MASLLDLQEFVGWHVAGKRRYSNEQRTHQSIISGWGLLLPVCF